MTRHARYAYGFFIVMLAAVLSLAGVGSAYAQQDQPTQTPGATNQTQQGQGTATQAGAAQAGNNTLGSILGQFVITEEQVRQVLVQNANLALDEGQTVTFPAGIAVTGAAGGTGTGQATATPAAGGTDAGGNNAGQATATQGAGGAGAGDGQTTATPAAGNDAGGGQTTATPAAGGTGGTGAQTTATPNAAGQAGFNCAAGQANPGQTYVIQEGDTLGELLGMMGLDAQAESNAGQSGQQGQVTTNQVIEFVYLNCDLRFDSDQALTVVVPAGIPQTGAGQGAQATQTPTQGQQQGGQATQTPTQGQQQGQTSTPQAGQQGAVPQTGAQAQQTQQAGTGLAQLCHPYADPENLRFLALYVVRGGDSLTGIARRFGTTVDELLARNPHIQSPNLIYTGQWILLHPGERVVVNPPNWQQGCNNQNR